MDLGRPRKKRSLVLNLTSLIDVLFLMLIFFMVTTTFLSQPAIKLQLPSASHADMVRQQPLVVHVDQLGRVFLNDDPIELPLLEAALEARLGEIEDKSIVLKADSRVSHGSVVRVLDMIKGAGVRKISFATDPGK